MHIYIIIIIKESHKNQPQINAHSQEGYKLGKPAKFLSKPRPRAF